MPGEDFRGGVGLGRFCLGGTDLDAADFDVADFDVADLAGVDRSAGAAGAVGSVGLDESAGSGVGFWLSRLREFRLWAFRVWLPRFDLDELADLAVLAGFEGFAVLAALPDVGWVGDD